MDLYNLSKCVEWSGMITILNTMVLTTMITEEKHHECVTIHCSTFSLQEMKLNREFKTNFSTKLE